jgi:hypothetical protein
VLGGLRVDVAELSVAVRMLAPLDRLGVGLQAEALLPQQVSDRVRADRVALAGELVGQLPGGLGRSAQWRHRISARARLDQGQQGRPQPPVHLSDPLASTAGAANPAQRLLARLHLLHALADRRLANPGCPRDGADPTVAQTPGLGAQKQTPLPLI